MKFGVTFTEYLHGDQESFLMKSSHIEYKRLKKVLKSCRRCRSLEGNSNNSGEEEEGCCEHEEEDHKKDCALSQYCQDESCPLCDQMFFSELMKEAAEIAGCFSSRVRRLVHLHGANGMQRYFIRLRKCFASDQQTKEQECQMLIQYVTMNAIAIRKILKKYDKVHSSVNGRNFKSKLRAEHIEILQSPWLIELGAFFLNFNESDDARSHDLFRPFYCDLSATEPIMTLTLSESVKLEYNLTCPICLDTVFNPYALSCGHLFCKSCACSAASVMIFEGVKAASPDSKCPVCREAGVYADAVHMVELNSLLKKRCKVYWKERMIAEHEETVKQSKAYWDLQTRYMLGY